jgi:hypothetical protein
MLAVVLGGVIAAAVAPSQIRDTGGLILTEPGRVVVATLLVWIGMPLVAAAAIPTIVGLPLGLGYFLFVLPMMAFLGLIVSGVWIGDAMVRRVRNDRTSPSPGLAAAIGIFVVILIGRFPVLGVAALIAVMLGAGAVALAVTRAARR